MFLPGLQCREGWCMVQCGAWWCRVKEDCVIISANFLEALLNIFQQNWTSLIAIESLFEAAQL